MENSFKKICYDNEPYYSLHHVKGYKVGKAYSGELHYDARLTLAYFKSGFGNIKIEGTDYTINKGDIFLLNYDELHFVSIDNEKFCERIILYLSEKTISDIPFAKAELLDAFYNRPRGIGNRISAETVKKHGLDIAVLEILNYAEKSNDTSNALALCKIIELLAKLNTIIDFGFLEQNKICKNPVINNIIKFIGDNFTDDITCEKISAEFHLSKFHLSRIFKEAVGVPLWDYVLIRRMFYFNDLLRKGFSAKEACYKAGFNNYSNFYRLYKKHMGITPTEFKNGL